MATAEAAVNLVREVEAIQIPDGGKITLSAGTSVRVTQSLGDSYTVMTDWGALLRIDDRDGDAIGKVAGALREHLQKKSAASEDSLEQRVWDTLRTTYDPEIPVNIVELGLVYLCELEPQPSGKNNVHIRFTLTAVGCGMGDVLKGDIERKLAALPEIETSNVELVFDPPWDRAMMSEAAKLQLGML